MNLSKRLVMWFGALLLASLSLACARESEEELLATPPPEEMMTGADRDAHGCIGSAGYSWCAKLSECVRPWELAEAQSFEVSETAFDAYCGNAPH
jgi:hypothetical protein